MQVLTLSLIAVMFLIAAITIGASPENHATTCILAMCSIVMINFGVICFSMSFAQSPSRTNSD